MKIDKSIFSKLDTSLEKLNSFRPFDKTALQNLHEDLVLRWTYNSNAIEGNTLTMNETKIALQGLTVGGKSLREHFEVINHREAILFIEDLAQKDTSFSQFDLKSIHSLILKNIDDRNSGKFRNINVFISGAEHIPPSYLEVENQINDFFERYNGEYRDLHPIERACRVHNEIVGIHPFTDGNGRTSRLIMNLELLKSGFPIAIVEAKNRLNYYEAIETALINNDYKPFCNMLIEILEKSFERYLFILNRGE